MTRRHDEKGDETVTTRLPSRFVAGLRDRARFRDITVSELMREMVERELAPSPVDRRLQMCTNIAQPDFSRNEMLQAVRRIEAGIDEMLRPWDGRERRRSA